jgi:acylphosphatase
MKAEDRLPAGSRMNARFIGQVQGVGFRYTTVTVAGRFAVTGYVRNLADGSVELAAEGPREEVSAFLDALRRSHVYRHVAREEISWTAPSGEYAEFIVG